MGMYNLEDCHAYIAELEGKLAKANQELAETREIHRQLVKEGTWAVPGASGGGKLGEQSRTIVKSHGGSFAVTGASPNNEWDEGSQCSFPLCTNED